MTSDIYKNNQGGYYEQGQGFEKSKWVSVINSHLRKIDEYGKFPIWRLMELAKTGKKSAWKAIAYYTVGKVI